MEMLSCKMGDVVALEQGLAINKKSKHLVVEKGLPLLRITDMFSQNFNQFIDAENLPEKFIAKPNDLIFSRTGQVGHIFRKQKGVIHNNCFRISPIEVVDRGFLFWFLKQDYVRNKVNNLASGSAQPDLNHDAFKSLNFSYPRKIEDQKRIAQVLDQYDKLIENNNRRIAILEDMAQSLYREWFVKFRYPGHENQTLIDSPLGPIPEGWEVKKLSEIARVNPESITKKNAPESIQYIDIKSVSSGSIDEIKEILFIEAPSRARRMVQHGDVIWATVRPNRKQYSFIARPKENTVVSTGFAVLRAEKVSPEYLYFAVTTDDFTTYLVNHATGSAYPAVSAKDFDNAMVLKPCADILKKFDALVTNCVAEMEVLKNKNVNLKQQRDLLLPKLISGKIII